MAHANQHTAKKKAAEKKAPVPPVPAKKATVKVELIAPPSVPAPKAKRRPSKRRIAPLAMQPRNASGISASAPSEPAPSPLASACQMLDSRVDAVELAFNRLREKVDQFVGAGIGSLLMSGPMEPESPVSRHTQFVVDTSERLRLLADRMDSLTLSIEV